MLVATSVVLAPTPQQHLCVNSALHQHPISMLFKFTIVVACALKYVDTLFSTASCAGIVDFEFAMADEARAQAIVHSWSPTQMLAVGVPLGLDYLYMLLFGSYSSCWRNGRVLTKP